MKTWNKLKALYSECFSDAESCVDYLFKYRLTADNAVFFRNDNEISVAMYLVPKTLIYNKTSLTVPFIVGLSTAKAYRKQGLAKKLLQKTISELKQPFIFLYPAVKGFYEKMDFATVSFDAKINTTLERTKATIEEVKKVYDNYTKDMDFYFLLTHNDIKEKIDITVLDNGQFYLLKDKGKTVGFGNGEENILLIDTEKQKGVMARIGNLKVAFQTLNITIKDKIKLTDSLIKENNICFSVDNGEIIIQDTFDIKMTVTELTEHFFGLGNKLQNFPKISGVISERY